MVFYCKMCGGELELDNDASIGCCQYCGTKQTIPKTDDEKILNLFNRANHYRMKNDFENAMGSYENILSEDADNAEAYWGLCLCRYGIEYVKDPVTEKMIPTCHRTQFESILEDDDFLSACEKADSVARSCYEEEAGHIDKIQKKILELSSKEEDYDVFICYKEADEMGERTPDSVIGQEIYEALTERGLRVFFARISLEDRLGTIYEPYIFAALQSAPVMITIGTKPEYMEAVWVKNEWSRFLAMMKKGAKKTLIPVYQTMNPYDMPEGFASIQAVNMEKLGAIQDLVHGVEKILGKSEKKVVENVIRVEENNTALGSYSPLLERAWIFLEDHEWDKADEYAERVLDLNPKCGEAYLIKMLVKMKIDDRTKLSAQSNTFDSFEEYKKIIKFGDEELVKEVESYNKIIRDRIEAERERIRQKKEEEIRKKEEEIKKKEEERKAKEQAIYCEYEESLKKLEGRVQELTDKKRQYNEKLSQAMAEKNVVEKEMMEIQEQYEESSKEYKQKVDEFETRQEKQKIKRDDIEFCARFPIDALFAIIAFCITQYNIKFPWLTGEGMSLFWYIAAIIVYGIIMIPGVIVGEIIYVLVFCNIYESYEPDYRKELKSYENSLSQNYPDMLKYSDMYDEIYDKFEDLSVSIIDLTEKRDDYSKELNRVTNELKVVKRKIKDRIDKIR